MGAQNRPGYTGEVIGINGNGEAQGGGSNNQSAIGNYAGNGGRVESMDLTIDGAPAMDPGCNCGTSVNPNPEMTQEFKVLQSNFNAEHAKGPVTMSVLSKSGGRDFHGTLYGYLRDYHMNSNEWFANKVGSDRVKNQFFYPGGNVGGPLIIPGTDFNKNRDKVFFFLGYEYFKQRLDTGFVKSWVPTAGDAQRRLQRHRWTWACRATTSTGRRTVLPTASSLRARSIPAERRCSTCIRCRTPIRPRPAASTTSTTCSSIRTGRSWPRAST